MVSGARNGSGGACDATGEKIAALECSVSVTRSTEGVWVAVLVGPVDVSKNSVSRITVAIDSSDRVVLSADPTTSEYSREDGAVIVVATSFFPSTGRWLSSSSAGAFSALFQLCFFTRVPLSTV